MKRFALVVIFLILTAITVYFFVALYPKLKILNGYAAKKACSCKFVADRDLSSIQKEDLAEAPLNLAQLKLDLARKQVSSSVYGLGKQTAQYKDGLGCVLVQGEDELNIQCERPQRFEPDTSRSWPYGIKDVPIKTYGINSDKIDQVLAYAFDKHGEYLKKTRALLIIQDDSIVAEKYAEGFDADTEILGWSMTKSMTNVLIGILVRKGLLDVHQNQLFPEWTDERSSIQLDNLLRMNSGLQWEEIYSEIADATKMLFTEEDMAAYVLNSKLEFAPGSVFEYSSGTSNLLSQLIRNQFDYYDDYLDFPYNSLFDPLGMESIVLETDEAGNYVLSSYCFATPRDWAKLGLLYLHEGVWSGDTIFTKQWLEYTLKPTEVSPDQSYGAHIWLNTNHNDIKNGPESMYKFSGYEGQYVYMIPDYNAVVVRMGLSEGPYFDIDGVIKLVLEGLQRKDNLTQ